MDIIPNMIFQHAEEAAFLWLLRDIAVNEPHYSLKDLAKLDYRIEAHLDGLRISGDDGWNICREELSWKEPGEVFSASVLAFESGKEDRIKEILMALEEDPELIRSVVSALGWIPYPIAHKYIQKFCFENDPLLRLIGISAYAVHRQSPPEELLLDMLNSENKLLKARAIKAMGELGKQNLMNYLKLNFENEDPYLSFAAAVSASILGNPNAPFMLKLLVNELDNSCKEEAITAACRRMNLNESNRWISELKEIPEQLRSAIIGAGAAGDPANIPWLIEMMKIDDLARKAGEAFAMITGIDLAYDDLNRKLPDGFEPGPTENIEEENVDLDPDENLPMPDPELIRKWWEKNKNQFKNGNRYLTGQPISKESLIQTLIKGKQRQRKASALESVMINPGQFIFNVKAPGFIQQKFLTAK